MIDDYKWYYVIQHNLILYLVSGHVMVSGNVTVYTMALLNRFVQTILEIIPSDIVMFGLWV